MVGRFLIVLAVIVTVQGIYGYLCYDYGRSRCQNAERKVGLKLQSKSVSTAHKLNVQAQQQQQKATQTLQERIHAIKQAHGACLDARLPDGL